MRLPVVLLLPVMPVQVSESVSVGPLPSFSVHILHINGGLVAFAYCPFTRARGSISSQYVPLYPCLSELVYSSLCAHLHPSPYPCTPAPSVAVYAESLVSVLPSYLIRTAAVALMTAQDRRRRRCPPRDRQGLVRTDRTGPVSLGVTGNSHRL